MRPRGIMSLTLCLLVTDCVDFFGMSVKNQSVHGLDIYRVIYSIMKRRDFHCYIRKYTKDKYDCSIDV